MSEMEFHKKCADVQVEFSRFYDKHAAEETENKKTFLSIYKIPTEKWDAIWRAHHTMIAKYGQKNQMITDSQIQAII